nr:uncharacterized protein LOC121125554 isoform X1 [Lepeophtheirus salmonis]XP_040576686.1 uncharacterized protein LOC121125554 isoform X1 [Lepeophtheirus salmonis]
MEDYQKFLDSDRVDSIRELLEKFDRRNIPSGIDEISRNNEMMFLSFDWENQEIRFSLKVQENLEIQLYHQTMQIPLSDVSHICKESKITATSQVGSLLSYLKSLTCSKKLIINKAVELLESVVLDQVSEVRHVDFIIEQLKLAFTTPKQRRYSQGLLTSCLQWKNCSPTLYKHLVKEDLICLPWPGHLTRLSQAFNLDTGIANSSRKYLLNRVPELTSNENKIIIDL